MPSGDGRRCGCHLVLRRRIFKVRRLSRRGKIRQPRHRRLYVVVRQRQHFLLRVAVRLRDAQHILRRRIQECRLIRQAYQHLARLIAWETLLPSRQSLRAEAFDQLHVGQHLRNVSVSLVLVCGQQLLQLFN